MQTVFEKKVCFIVLILISLFTGICAHAQPDGQHGQPPIPNSTQIKKMVNDLSTELSLSDEQETKIHKLYVAHFKEVKEKTESRKAGRREMEALKASFEKEIKALLTKEQQKKFDAFQNKNRPRQGPRQKPSK